MCYAIGINCSLLEFLVISFFPFFFRYFCRGPNEGEKRQTKNVTRTWNSKRTLSHTQYTQLALNRRLECIHSMPNDIVMWTDTAEHGHRPNVRVHKQKICELHKYFRQPCVWMLLSNCFFFFFSRIFVYVCWRTMGRFETKWGYTAWMCGGETVFVSCTSIGDIFFLCIHIFFSRVGILYTSNVDDSPREDTMPPKKQYTESLTE